MWLGDEISRGSCLDQLDGKVDHKLSLSLEDFCDASRRVNPNLSLCKNRPIVHAFCGMKCSHADDVVSDYQSRDGGGETAIARQQRIVKHDHTGVGNWYEILPANKENQIRALEVGRRRSTVLPQRYAV